MRASFQLLTLSALIIFSNAYATTGENLIGIQLSQTCLTEVKDHLKTDCPTYKDLIKYDNTNQFAYGKFTNLGGFYHRLPSPVPNYYNVLDPHKTIVAVDPENNFIRQAKMIIIQPGNLTFINKDESINDNHTRSVYSGRSMYSCSQATISYSDFLLSDTIKYLDSECTKTSYVDKTTFKIESHPFSFINPYSSLHITTYLQNIFHGHKLLTNEKMPTGGGLGPSNCINKKCNYKDPTAKW